jgi:hypothetical protein
MPRLPLPGSTAAIRLPSPSVVTVTRSPVISRTVALPPAEPPPETAVAAVAVVVVPAVLDTPAAPAADGMPPAVSARPADITAARRMRLI